VFVGVCRGHWFGEGVWCGEVIEWNVMSNVEVDLVRFVWGVWDVVW
jgi:hypothetical protein